MAVLIFLFGGEPSESFLEGREVEDRIVTESAGAPGPFENLSINAIGDYRQNAALSRERNRANEMSPPFVASLAA